MSTASGRYVTANSVRVTNITLFVITSIIAITRLSITAYSTRRFRWDDGWLLAAYVLYISLSILYLVSTEKLFRFTGLATGAVSPWPSIAEDEMFLRRIIFVVTILLWAVLWSVKFSLLSFYKQLLVRLKGYMRLWWALIIFCILTLTGTIFSLMFACATPFENLKLGGCADAAGIRGTTISLWYSYAVDIITDLLIMLLPFGVIRKAQMPLRQKLSICGLFCLGLVIMVAATIRVREVNTTISANTTPQATWLALWSLIEASIAIIIGSGPGLYRAGRDYNKSKKGSYDNRPSGYASFGSKSNGRQHSAATDIALPTYFPQKGRGGTFIQSNHRSMDDATSSQEELAKSPQLPPSAIHVTKSTSLGVADRDDRSLGEWDDKYFRAV